MAVLSTIKKSLLSIGAFILILFAVFYLTLFFQLRGGGVRQLDEFGYEFQSVAAWFAANGQSVQLEMLDSYNQTGSWAGDIEKGLSVRITGLDQESLEQTGGVVRGDRLTPTLADSLEFVTDLLGGGQLDWFPAYDVIVSDEYYVVPLQLGLQGEYPDSVQLLIMHPQDNMAFYAWVKI